MIPPYSGIPYWRCLQMQFPDLAHPRRSIPMIVMFMNNQFYNLPTRLNAKAVVRYVWLWLLNYNIKLKGLEFFLWIWCCNGLSCSTFWVWKAFLKRRCTQHVHLAGASPGRKSWSEGARGRNLKLPDSPEDYLWRGTIFRTVSESNTWVERLHVSRKTLPSSSPPKTFGLLPSGFSRGKSSGSLSAIQGADSISTLTSLGPFIKLMSSLHNYLSQSQKPNLSPVVSNIPTPVH